MRGSPSRVALVIVAICAAGSFTFACGTGGAGGGFHSGSSSGGSPGGGAPDSEGGVVLIGGGSAPSTDGGSSGSPPTAVCPSTWQCDVGCSGNGTTSITGTVMDPAGSDPLYDVVVYVPTTALGSLPAGVPTGASACSCSALFQGNPLVFATTDVNGRFSIKNAPVAKNVPLVVQVGKWRKQLTVDTTACAETDAGTINLPKNGTEGDIPDIAVSTGAADSLECLLRRVGLDASEYVPGWTQPGHVHIFSGGGGGGVEKNPMAGAPVSSASLWDSTTDLMKNDIVLLSCEGQETADPVPQNLEEYLNAGGRAFASHFHYAWFTGGKAPPDWGNNLAQWTPGANSSASDTTPVGGVIQTTLNAGSGAFAKGVALQQWLAGLGALGGPAPLTSTEVPIIGPRYNANVTAANAPSQAWIDLDPNTDVGGRAGTADTLYFSFDTPVATPPGGEYCGRAVFSGLHVGGASFDGVNCTGTTPDGGKGTGAANGCNAGHVPAAQPPAGCDTTHPLSAQEKVLEFMLFDLSACVIPDNVAPTNDAGVPVIPR